MVAVEEFSGSSHPGNRRALAPCRISVDIGIGVLATGLAESLSTGKYANSLFEWRWRTPHGVRLTFTVSY